MGINLKKRENANCLEIHKLLTDVNKDRCKVNGDIS